VVSPSAAEGSAELSSREKEQVGRLRAFVTAHGGPATAVIGYLGRSGARIVVVAGDGAFGDAIVSGIEAGAAVCEQAGIPVADGWDRELSAQITPSPADRQRMAGTGR
jgi:hypothetical protein